MYRLKTGKDLTPSLASKYIDADLSELARMNKLRDYYLGKHAILQRAAADPAKPNNKLVNPYAQYITDIMTGYFMGAPVKYAASESGTQLLDELNLIYAYNDESAENAELAKESSMYGKSVEMLYLDDDAMIRFRRVDARGCIPIYDDTIEDELLYLIRYYIEPDILTNNPITYVEVYGRSSVRYYRRDTGSLKFLRETAHQFGLVPIVIYANNEDQLGDYEIVIPLIDAYDVLMSDSINDMEYFADAYLLLSGYDGTDAADIAKMKEQRVILAGQGGSAQWLIKDVPDGALENIKTRVDDAIHKFSKCPAMTDEDFASNASGVAMKYKLMGLENATSKKERAFKRGLQRRIELICNVLAITSATYDYRSIKIKFSRNIPANLTELAQVVSNLSNLLSRKAQLDILPLEIDYDQNEQERKDESEAGYIAFGGVNATGNLTVANATDSANAADAPITEDGDTNAGK